MVAALQPHEDVCAVNRQQGLGVHPLRRLVKGYAKGITESTAGTGLGNTEAEVRVLSPRQRVAV